MHTLIQDLRYGLRGLRKSPAFTVIAVLTLGLGIGANTAIYSIVNTVLIRPLPYPQADRLMFVSEVIQRSTGDTVEGPASYPDFLDWRAQNHVFESMASYHDDDFTLTGVDEPIHLTAQTVSSDFFSVLGSKPFMGRDFQPDDEKPGSRIVILSHEMWRTAFNANLDILNHNITLDQQSYMIVGIMPAGFAFPLEQNSPGLWRSSGSDAEAAAAGNTPATSRRSYHFLSVIGRLKPGLSLDQARVDMGLIAEALARQYPDTNAKRSGIRIVPELEELVGDTRPGLRILALAVGCILLIACVNVANLLLVRASQRSQEIAIRAALGASRSRLITLFLTESCLLGISGAVVGIPLAYISIKLFVGLKGQNLPRIRNLGLDANVLMVTLAVAILTSLIFGLLPALRGSRPNFQQALKDGGRGRTMGVAHHRWLSAFVVAETAIGLVLLVLAGLLLRSLHNLLNVDPGFDPKNVLTFNIDMPNSYTDEQQIQFYDRLLQQLKAPGVTSVAAIWPLPLSNNYAKVGVEVEGHPASPGEENTGDLRFTTSGYFHTMGIPVKSGRDFNDHDNSSSRPVIIINQVFAQRYFRGQDPLGRHVTPRIGIDGKYPPREIIGVVGNVKHRSLSSDFTPEYYLFYKQVPVSLTFCLRTSSDPILAIPMARRALNSIDPNVPLYNERTFEDYIAGSLSEPDFHTLLLEVFAGLALILTAVGLYGVISHSVVQRRAEISIRMAFGATRLSVWSMILKAGLRLTVIGILIGIGCAVVTLRSLSSLASLLFRVNPLDILTFAAVIVILSIVSTLASYVPARRAMHVDPITTLKYE